MSNLLIVESENDKYFIEAFVEYLNLNIKVDEAICSVDEYECLGSMSKLENKLKALRGTIEKYNIEKIGIIFDADDVGIEQRTKKINEKISSVFPNGDIFEIYIMNIDGRGELETVLKKIAHKDSSMADCLEKWEECLPEDKKIKLKDFDKFWVQIYQRYDCCTKKKAKQAGKNCNNKVSINIDNYNFNHQALNALKEFLENFKK